jgi:chemotaxis protein MotB
MRDLRMGLAAIGLLALAFTTGCQNRMHDDNVALRQQNLELQERNRVLEAQRMDPNQIAALQGEIASRDAKIMELEQQLRQPTPGVDAPGIAGIETSYNAATGQMTVNLPGDVLFDSGRATLKPSAKSTLDKVAGALRGDYAGRRIFVDGHTDSDPINKTKGQWEDNWHLAAARANAVRQYLVSRGVDAKLIALRAYGPNAPKGSKDASRRVEIVVQVG